MNVLPTTTSGTRPLAPAHFLGVQEGFGSIPAIELWNLTADLPGHPAGSSVSRETIEAAGYRLPERSSLLESGVSAHPQNLNPRFQTL